MTLLKRTGNRIIVGNIITQLVMFENSTLNWQLAKPMHSIKYYQRAIAYSYNEKSKPKEPTLKRKPTPWRNSPLATRWKSKNHRRESAKRKVLRGIIRILRTWVCIAVQPARATTKRSRISWSPAYVFCTCWKIIKLHGHSESLLIPSRLIFLIT